MIVEIQEEILPDGNRYYSIVSGTSCSFGSFKWFRIPFSSPSSRQLVSENTSYTTTTPPIINDQIYVSVTEYLETYWLGGEFYGGDFSGNFGGGTFHYGQLNNCFYLKQEIKPRPFIENINNPTGPQSVKPVNTSRLA